MLAALRILAVLTLGGGLGCASDARAPYADGDARTPDAGRDARAGTTGDAGAATRDDAPGGAAEDASTMAGDGGAGSSASDGSAMTAGCDDGPTLRVLLLGNSYTAANDLAGLTARLACAAGTKLVTQAVTPGGFRLIDHASAAGALDAIAAQAWDFAVLQDQSQVPGFRPSELELDFVPGVRQLVQTIHAQRAQTRALFLRTWARRDGDSDNCDYYPLLCSFEGQTRALEQGYDLYLERTESELVAGGLAWALVRADAEAPLDPRSLWSDDGSHPALSGSYLTAAMLVAHILDREVSGLGETAGLDAAVAAYLRRIADRATAQATGDPLMRTLERVQLTCSDAEACATYAADAARVVFSMSASSCTQLADDLSLASARRETSMACADGVCTTLALGGWHALGAGLAQGSYQVHAYVDLDGDGTLSAGDLESCQPGYAIGSGQDLTLTSPQPR